MIDDPSTPEAEALDPREARAADRLADLRRLRKIGMALSEAMLARVHDAMRDHEPEDTRAVALEFDRLSRAVYRIAGLETRLDGEKDALAARVADERAARRAEDKRRRDELFRYRRDCVDEAVHEAIVAETAVTGDEARALRLEDALCERLEDPREDNDIADVPVSTVIARICAHLGVAPDWSLWEDEAWAVAEECEAVPGSPYVGWGDGARKCEVEEALLAIEPMDGAGPRASLHDPPERWGA